MKFGIIGSGSWGTALAKILTDNGHKINWWIRSDENIHIFKNRRHNPQYLRNTFFDTRLINFSANIQEVINESDTIIIVVPSAFLKDVFRPLPNNIFKNKDFLPFGNCSSPQVCHFPKVNLQ